MGGSLRSFLCLILAAAAIAAITPVRANAQDALWRRTGPTFVTPAPLVIPAPQPAIRHVTPLSDARLPTQAPSGRRAHFGWDVEVHTGGSWSHAPDAPLRLPERGETFLMFNFFETRAVRSWYFGDGAALLNAHLGSAGLTARMTALDPVLNASSVSPASVSPFGVRIGRSMTERLGVEFAFEMMGAFEFTDAARQNAEWTRSAFETAFGARFASFSTHSVTSDLTIADRAGRQVLVTGALRMNLRSGGRLMPYIVLGGGALVSTGDSPELSLAGDYQFVSGSGTPYRQTDTLGVRYTSGTAFAMLAGGGFTFDLTARSGVRVDFRGHFATDPVKVLLNWSPATIAGTPLNTIAFFATPGIQISTSGANRSTLSLVQTEPDFAVATGDGMRRIANLTIGYFYRFPTAAPAQRARPAPGPGSGDRLWDGGRKWEVDVHAGGTLGDLPSAGTAINAFPVGAPLGIVPSRYASTWMFGDGAVLINQIAAGYTAIPVVDRMRSLDPVLTGQSLEQSGSGSFGARISRRLTSRLRAELAVETTAGTLAFSEDAGNRIEATRASFAPVWSGIIATGGGFLFLNPSVSATADLTSARQRQTSVTGGVEVRLWNRNRFVSYASGAAGIVRHSGPLPEATITGLYQFTFYTSAPFSEQDVVRVHYTARQTTPLVALGGGMKYFLTSRHGVRVDVRINLSDRSIDTLVDASPASIPGLPMFAIASTTNPALVLSNTPAVRGNLTGPSIVDLKTFAVSGWEVRPSITAGYFFRF